jgi:hypothetical protein
MAMQRSHDEAVTAPLGTALMIGIAILFAIGLFFMVRVFTGDGDDPQALATFQLDEATDTLTVRTAERDSLRSEFEIRLSVDGDFDDEPLAVGAHAIVAGQFVAMGGAAGGADDGPLSAGTTFHFCAAGGSVDSVSFDIRHTDTNSVIQRGTFAGLQACP